MPALAVVVGLAQMAAATLGPLTSWKGGGFGMFARLDGIENRFLHVVVFGPAGEEYIVDWTASDQPIRESFSRADLTSIRVLPTPNRLRRLARTIAAADVRVRNARHPLRPSVERALETCGMCRRTQQGQLVGLVGAGMSEDSLAISAVTVSVMRPQFKWSDGRLRLVELARQTVHGPTGSSVFGPR